MPKTGTFNLFMERSGKFAGEDENYLISTLFNEHLSMQLNVDVKNVEALLAAGVDVNIENEDGRMALGHATRGPWDASHEDQQKCVNIFLSAGADVKKGYRYGFTALLCAAENGLETCMNRMLQATTGAVTASGR